MVSGQTIETGLGTIRQTVTFPTAIAGCVALATPTIDDGLSIPVEPMETSIDGATVTVRETNSGSGIENPFAVVVFCSHHTHPTARTRAHRPPLTQTSVQRTIVASAMSPHQA
jgi:hypothetical protein